MITNNTFLATIIIICGVIGAILMLLSICMIIIVTIAEYRTNKYKDKLKNLYMYEYSCAYNKYINEFSVDKLQNSPSFVLAKKQTDDYMNLYFYNILFDNFSNKNAKKYLLYYLANKDMWTNEVLSNIQNKDNIKEP